MVIYIGNVESMMSGLNYNRDKPTKMELLFLSANLDSVGMVSCHLLSPMVDFYQTNAQKKEMKE